MTARSVTSPVTTVDWTTILDRLDRWGRFVCITLGLVLGLGYAITGVHNDDGGIFWRAGHSATYYVVGWESAQTYIYPPPLAQLAGLVPWAVFIVPWTLLIWASFWYALRWLALPVIVVGVVWYATIGDGVGWAPLSLVWIGNPQAIIAAAIVAGFRHPAAWAFVLLTKIGPGVGLVWFAVRREWRSLAIVATVTVLVAWVSAVLAPGTWLDFLEFARTNAGTPPPVAYVDIPLGVRVAMSLVLVAWGAWTDRQWTVPVAAAWSAIALYEWSFVLIWLSAIPLWANRRAGTSRRLACTAPRARRSSLGCN